MAYRGVEARSHIGKMSHHGDTRYESRGNDKEPFEMVNHLPVTEDLIERLLDMPKTFEKAKQEMEEYRRRTLTEKLQNYDQHTFQSAIDDLNNRLEGKIKEVEELKKQKKELQTSFEKQREDVNRSNTNDATVEEYKKILHEEKQKYKDEKEILITKAQQRIRSEQSLRQKADGRSEELQQNISKLEKEIDIYKSNERANSKANRQHVSESMEMKQLKMELEETKTRLSKMMGTKLSDNNPNITDLSDKNRPSKLGERYQELYDNQWTDAFEMAETVYRNEKECVGVLLKILVSVKQFCDDETRKYEKKTKNALYIDDENTKELPEYVNKALKDCRKALALENVESMFQKFMRNTPKETKRGILTHQLQSYVRECVEICWLMALQDPPVVFGSNVSKYSPFDTNVYRPYTISGLKIDFVVWPPIYLHEGGPILGKGVAQGYKYGAQPEDTPTSQTYLTKDEIRYMDDEKKRKQKPQYQTDDERRDPQRFDYDDRRYTDTEDKGEEDSSSHEYDDQAYLRTYIHYAARSQKNSQLPTATKSLYDNGQYYATTAATDLTSTHYGTTKGTGCRQVNRQTLVPKHRRIQAWGEESWRRGTPSKAELNDYEYYLSNFGETKARNRLGEKFDVCRRYIEALESDA